MRLLGKLSNTWALEEDWMEKLLRKISEVLLFRDVFFRLRTVNLQEILVELWSSLQSSRHGGHEPATLANRGADFHIFFGIPIGGFDAA